MVGKDNRENGERAAIETERLKTGYERLKLCLSHDACDITQCAYFLKPEELTEIVSLLERTIEKAENFQ